jgi:hypothetical protein
MPHPSHPENDSGDVLYRQKIRLGTTEFVQVHFEESAWRLVGLAKRGPSKPRSFDATSMCISNVSQ